ncbi:MAG: hypothetical protein HRT47_11185 [Candidatus Caenarcaniphilales bacterium]|nr:hypothetical protein [Candidatus Caenarcaniphilales bacterium]
MYLRVLALILISIFSFSAPAIAGLPKYILKFDNIVQKRKAMAPLLKDWEFYLKDHSEILYNKPTHKFKNDQFCRFSFDLDEKKNIDKQSIKMLDSKGNYAFNLGALDFLQNTAFHFRKGNEESPVTVDMRYQSY